tara:strand:- start:791 stop:1030 length:240 start_codon:yes stop_codon:yes gene_type:complete
MKTYRIFYAEAQEKYIDIPARNKDEALQDFDMKNYNESRIAEVKQLVQPKITSVEELGFDIFAEIDAITDHYLKPGGTD